MKKFSLKVWKFKKLYYFCVPLRKNGTMKTHSVVIRAMHMAKHLARRDPPHIWFREGSSSSSQSQMAKTKRKTFFSDESLEVQKTLLLLRPASQKCTANKSKLHWIVSEIWKQNTDCKCDQGRVLTNPDSHQSSLKYR
jgi:hypothetical protein